MIDKLKEAISKKNTIIITANCTVNYSGRTETHLPKGERIIIIKTDGTLLIHQPKGNTPINYMKENTTHTIKEIKETITINSNNKNSKEYMNIELHKINSIITEKLTDNEKITLAGSEKDMSDMIYNNPNLIEQGFKPLSREEHTKYGFIDVFGYDKEKVLVVIECKRNTANFQAIEQLERYVNKIKETKGLQKVRGIIASPEITTQAQKMLKEKGYEYKKVQPPKKLEKYNSGQKGLLEYFK